jgi:hypothetical protein
VHSPGFDNNVRKTAMPAVWFNIYSINDTRAI